MPWGCTTLEDFDDDQATAAAGTDGLALIGGGSDGLAFRFCNGEQLTGAGDVVGARAFGEQAVVADSGQTPWQHVDEEAAGELVDRECHGVLPFALPGAVVLSFLGHTRILTRDHTAVCDCNPI